jgi:peptidoglycan hydrolase-like amidase
MYSASSGGYTAFNSVLKFPVVTDDGDSTPNNPYHTWTTTLTAAAVQAAYPSIGTFSGITVVARNGAGEWGGRVTAVTVQGRSGGVTVTGDQFRSAMGLRSTWFTVAGAPLTGAGTVTIPATALAPAKRLGARVGG